MQKVNRTLDLELRQGDQEQYYQDIETFESNMTRESLHRDALKTRTILMDQLIAHAAEAERFKIAARNLLDFSRTAQDEAVIVRSDAEKPIRRACLFELYPSIIAVSSALKAESTLGAVVEAESEHDQTTLVSAIEAESEHAQGAFALAAAKTARAAARTAAKAAIAAAKTAIAAAKTAEATVATAEATAATVAAAKAIRASRAAASALAINAAQVAEADVYVASLTEHTAVRYMMPIKRKIAFVFHILPRVPS